MGLPFSCVLLRIMYIMLNRMHNWAGIWTWNAVLGVFIQLSSHGQSSMGYW